MLHHRTKKREGEQLPPSIKFSPRLEMFPLSEASVIGTSALSEADLDRPRSFFLRRLGFDPVSPVSVSRCWGYEHSFNARPTLCCQPELLYRYTEGLGPSSGSVVPLKDVVEQPEGIKPLASVYRSSLGPGNAGAMDIASNPDRSYVADFRHLQAYTRISAQP